MRLSQNSACPQPGVWGVPRLGSEWRGTRAPCLRLELCGEKGAGPAIPQWQPGRSMLWKLALRCSRSWISAATLTPRAQPGAALVPGTHSAGQQVAARSQPLNFANVA